MPTTTKTGAMMFRISAVTWFCFRLAPDLTLVGPGDQKVKRSTPPWPSLKSLTSITKRYFRVTRGYSISLISIRNRGGGCCRTW